MTSNERLNVNLSTAFIELFLETLNSLSRESEHVLEKPRGIRAPYRIRNLTGITLRLWADGGRSGRDTRTNATVINDSETIDWRFDDWRTMREVSFYIPQKPIINVTSSMPRRVIVVSQYSLLTKYGRNLAVSRSTGKGNIPLPYAQEQKSTTTDCFAKSR